jgi:hypothetical protein
MALTQQDLTKLRAAALQTRYAPLSAVQTAVLARAAELARADVERMAVEYFAHRAIVAPK